MSKIKGANLKEQLTLSVISVRSVEMLVEKREWVEGGDEISRRGRRKRRLAKVTRM